MDPNVFQVDWERTLEALVGIIILSFLIERVSALLFESRFFARNTKVPADGSDEYKRERAAAETALNIIEAEKDAEAVHEIAVKLEPSNPLWPADDGNASGLVKRARELLGRIRRLNDRRHLFAHTPVKEIVAFVLAAGVCIAWDFDALSIILLSEHTSLAGAVLTGAVVAGGSKASIRLFHDLLGVKSRAMQEMRDRSKGDK